MAEINNITIKNLKRTKTKNDVPIFSANIYYKGEKLGRWRMNKETYDGEYSFDPLIIKTEADDYVENRVKDARANHGIEMKNFRNTDTLLINLIRKNAIETAYKKGKNAGMKSLILCIKNNKVNYYFSKDNSKDAILDSNDYKQALEKWKDLKANYTYVYTDLQDFVINTHDGRNIAPKTVKTVKTKLPETKYITKKEKSLDITKNTIQDISGIEIKHIYD